MRNAVTVFSVSVILMIGLTIMLLSGCQNPSQPIPDPSPTPTTAPVTHTLIVKNSLWQTVNTVEVTGNIENNRDLASDQAALNAEIAKYNALTTSDLQRLYVDIAPDIGDAPAANIFICNPDTNIPNMSLLNVPRQYLIDNWAGYQQDAIGQVLYIDHIPPAPILAKDTTPYEWYSIYVIEDAPTAGVILYEDHCGYHADESFHGQWITTPIGQFAPDGTPGGGWVSIDAYYYQTWQSYNQSCSYPASNWPGVTAAHMYTRAVYPPLPTN
jgi:hypothetical protein